MSAGFESVYSLGGIGLLTMPHLDRIRYLSKQLGLLARIFHETASRECREWWFFGPEGRIQKTIFRAESYRDTFRSENSFLDRQYLNRRGAIIGARSSRLHEICGLAPSLTLCLILGCFSAANSSIDKADRLIEHGQYQEAIEVYRGHISERLAVSDRPDWENPHFYLLSIADLQLRMAQPELALQTCEEAEKAGVDRALVADRYRTVAHWYEERRDLQKSFEVLKRYRDRDSLLFEAMLDRVGRAITTEDERHHER